jgi:hypothetical protein
MSRTLVVHGCMVVALHVAFPSNNTPDDEELNTNLLTPPAAGTLVTASAHIITAVIGSGVLSLAWAIAQLGWMIGPVVLVAFSVITWFCSSLLADCYRAPDPVHGKRNYTYGQAVRAYLGTYDTLLDHSIISSLLAARSHEMDRCCNLLATTTNNNHLAIMHTHVYKP